MVMKGIDMNQDQIQDAIDFHSHEMGYDEPTVTVPGTALWQPPKRLWVSPASTANSPKMDSPSTQPTTSLRRTNPSWPTLSRSTLIVNS